MDSLPARAWFLGYGSRLVPYLPYEALRVPGEDDRIIVAHHAPDGVKTVQIAPGATREPGTARVGLGQGVEHVSDVLAFVELADHRGGWHVFTRDYVVPWPPGWTVWSTPYEVDWAFWLTPRGVERDAMVYVQGPWDAGSAPRLENLTSDTMPQTAAGQLTALAGTCSWIEVGYALDGIPWRQRRYLVPLRAGVSMLVTAQAPESVAGFFDVAEHLVSAMAPRFDK